MNRHTAFLLAALPLSLMAQPRAYTLDECRQMARDNHPTARNAALEVSSARERKGEALAEYFPTVKASAAAYHAFNPLISLSLVDIAGTSDAAWELQNRLEDYGNQNGVKTTFEALQYGYGATLSAMQPVYAGGRIVNGNRLARLGVEAAELQQEVKLQETDALTEEKFWQVVSLTEKQGTASEALSTLDSLLRYARSATGAGLITTTELLTLENKRDETALAATRLRGGIRLAKMDLLNAMGADYTVTGVDSLTLLYPHDSLPAPEACYIPEEELAARMRENRLLDLQAEAKELQKKMTIGETLPEIGIGAFYGYGKYLGDASANGAALVSVQVPLSDWGKAAHRIRRYANDAEMARNDRDYLSAQLLLKARQLWVTLSTAYEELQVAAKTRDVSRDTYAKTAGQLEAGTVTMGDLLQARLALRQADDALTDARIAYRRALSEYTRY